MNYETIILEKKGHIATLTLNRPDDLNALSPQVYDELYDVCDDVTNDGETRVLVIKGNGRAFCAGADLKEVHKILGDVPGMRRFVELCHRTYDAIEALPIPTVASVHGMVLAGGIELAEVCDIIIAAESCRIGDQHAGYGLIAGGGGTQRDLAAAAGVGPERRAARSPRPTTAHIHPGRLSRGRNGILFIFMMLQICFLKPSCYFSQGPVPEPYIWGSIVYVDHEGKVRLDKASRESIYHWFY